MEMAEALLLLRGYIELEILARNEYLKYYYRSKNIKTNGNFTDFLLQPTDSAA